MMILTNSGNSLKLTAFPFTSRTVTDITRFNGLLSTISLILSNTSLSTGKCPGDGQCGADCVALGSSAGINCSCRCFVAQWCAGQAADVNGYQAIHVAAQYGQTVFVNHIVAKYHADLNVPDNDGRSPLHWAAYKGFGETIRLLLFRDAFQGRQDKDGLHSFALGSIKRKCRGLHFTYTCKHKGGNNSQR